MVLLRGDCPLGVCRKAVGLHEQSNFLTRRVGPNRSDVTRDASGSVIGGKALIQRDCRYRNHIHRKRSRTEHQTHVDRPNPG